MPMHAASRPMPLPAPEVLKVVIFSLVLAVTLALSQPLAMVEATSAGFDVVSCANETARCSPFEYLSGCVDGGNKTRSTSTTTAPTSQVVDHCGTTCSNSCLYLDSNSDTDACNYCSECTVQQTGPNGCYGPTACSTCDFNECANPCSSVTGDPFETCGRCSVDDISNPGTYQCCATVSDPTAQCAGWTGAGGGARARNRNLLLHSGIAKTNMQRSLRNRSTSRSRLNVKRIRKNK